MKKPVLSSILVAVALLAVGVIAEAQQPKKVSRIGYLSTSWTEPQKRQMAAFKQGMRELGYVEGQNYVIEYRNAKGKRNRVPEAAAELVRLKVDIILTSPGRRPILTAQQTTRTIPIVMVGSQVDPVDAGFVDSLARPGGNITGLTDIRGELHGKRLELLKEVSPQISRVAIVWGGRQEKRWGKKVKTVGHALGIQIQSVLISRTRLTDGSVFSEISREDSEGVIVTGGAGGYVGRHRALIIDFAVKKRLPTIFLDSQFVDAGGLMAYGTDVPDIYRQAATYVDKILKGRKPADLPVERPRKFELVINLKAAKQIGLTIPQWTLMKADRVIK